MTDAKRRQILGFGAALGVAGAFPLPLLARSASGAADPVAGGTLVLAEFPEPTLLTSALIAAAPTNNISPKIFDGLLYYDVETLEP